MGALDATSKKKMGVVQAHHDEIINLAFFER